MPTPGVNVLENPTWDDVNGDGKPRGWLTQATWDPLLAWGCAGAELTELFGTDGGLEVLGSNSLRVDWSRSTQLDPARQGYGGLLYAGGGFDAAPGDTWRVAFNAIRRAFPANFVLPTTSIGPTSDLFVRVGIVVVEAGEFVSYTMSLPAAGLGIAGSGVAYDETFEIPSDWPEGPYQFAIVTTGVQTLPVNSTYRWGLRMDFADAWLSFEGAGGGSPGNAGVLHPFANWPVPSFRPGSEVCDPPTCCGGILEWDQFDFNDPLDDAVVTSGTLPHTHISGFVTEGRNDSWYWLEEEAPVFDPFSRDHEFFIGTGTEINWCSCADWCMTLGVYYTAVPIREYQFTSLGGGQYVSTREFRPLLVHPSSLGGRQDGEAPIPSDRHAIFCWPSCPPGENPIPEGQPVYLTHEVAPGDLHTPAGGTGGLELRGVRAAPGDGNAAATGPPGIDLGHIKGQP